MTLSNDFRTADIRVRRRAPRRAEGPACVSLLGPFSRIPQECRSQDLPSGAIHYVWLRFARCMLRVCMHVA